MAVEGAGTNLLIEVKGTPYTLDADVTETTLAVAPSTNNTCLVNDTTATDHERTRILGEGIRELTIDNIGSEITSLNGTYQAFKVGNEYFMAYVDTDNNRLYRGYRGYFYDSSLEPINRETIANNDTITLMKLGFVFLDKDLTTIDVTYTNPTHSGNEPDSPATADYWMDMDDNQWKRYDGSNWQDVDRVFLGHCVMDETNCVAARSTHFSKMFSEVKTMEFEKVLDDKVRVKNTASKLSVYGTTLNFGSTLPSWDMDGNLATSADMYNVAEQASMSYYMYISEGGKSIISDISPYYLSELQGFYHPHNTWRCVVKVYNNASSNIDTEMIPLGDYNIRTNIGETVSHFGTLPEFALQTYGAEVECDKYEALFLRIGLTYDASPTAGTFKLPPVDARFMRGKQSGGTLGQLQANAYAAHDHSGKTDSDTHSHLIHHRSVGSGGTYGSVDADSDNSGSINYVADTMTADLHDHDISSSGTGTETMPDNIRINIGIIY